MSSDIREIYGEDTCWLHVGGHEEEGSHGLAGNEEEGCRPMKAMNEAYAKTLAAITLNLQKKAALNVQTIEEEVFAQFVEWERNAAIDVSFPETMIDSYQRRSEPFLSWPKDFEVLKDLLPIEKKKEENAEGGDEELEGLMKTEEGGDEGLEGPRKTAIKCAEWQARSAIPELNAEADSDGGHEGHEEVMKAIPHAGSDEGHEGHEEVMKAIPPAGSDEGHEDHVEVMKAIPPAGGDEDHEQVMKAPQNIDEEAFQEYMLIWEHVWGPPDALNSWERQREGQTFSRFLEKFKARKAPPTIEEEAYQEYMRQWEHYWGPPKGVNLNQCEGMAFQECLEKFNARKKEKECSKGSGRDAGPEEVRTPENPWRLTLAVQRALKKSEHQLEMETAMNSIVGQSMSPIPEAEEEDDQGAWARGSPMKEPMIEAISDGKREKAAMKKKADDWDNFDNPWAEMSGAPPSSSNSSSGAALKPRVRLQQQHLHHEQHHRHHLHHHHHRHHWYSQHSHSRSKGGWCL